MKNFSKAAIFGTALAGIGLAGAGGVKLASAEAENPGLEGASLAPWQFVEGRGVKLTESGVAIAGVELAHVSFGEAVEKTYITASGQIFSASRENATARVNIMLPVRQAEGIEAGARIGADGPPGSPAFSGRVEQVDRQAAAATGQVELIASLDDPNGALGKGSFVTCHVDLSGTSVAEALRIPASALLTTARGTFVYVLNGDHYFRSPVEAGRKSDSTVEIVDGLFEGDVVVSAGVEDLWLIELQAINGGESCADSH